MLSFVLLFFALLGVYLLYKGVRLVTDRLFPDEKNTNVTNAAVLDRVLATSQINQVESISARYELVKDNPLDYNEEDRKAVTEEYRDLLVGRIKDPDGFHAPRERDGHLVNPDYIRYLRNQIRVLGHDCWHKQESARVRQVRDEENVGVDYRRQLLDFGANPALVHPMTSHEARMEEYDAQDWKELIRVTNDYLKTNSPREVIIYLEEVTDKDVLIDRNKFELFALLLEKDVPRKIAGVFMTAKLSEENLAQVLELLDQNVGVDDALSLVLSEEKRRLELEIARKEMSETLR